MLKVITSVLMTPGVSEALTAGITAIAGAIVRKIELAKMRKRRNGGDSYETN